MSREMMWRLRTQEPAYRVQNVTLLQHWVCACYFRDRVGVSNTIEI